MKHALRLLVGLITFAFIALIAYLALTHVRTALGTLLGFYIIWGAYVYGTVAIQFITDYKRNSK